VTRSGWRRLKHEDLDVGAVLGLSAAELVRERADLAARWQMLSVFPAPFECSAAAAVCEIRGFLTLPNLRSICKALTVHLDMAESKSSALLV